MGSHRMNLRLSNIFLHCFGRFSRTESDSKGRASQFLACLEATRLVFSNGFLTVNCSRGADRTSGSRAAHKSAAGASHDGLYDFTYTEVTCLVHCLDVYSLLCRAVIEGGPGNSAEGLTTLHSLFGSAVAGLILAEVRHDARGRACLHLLLKITL